ncbi:helix-turn-helix transcriptional regulator [Escherichia coli]|nr:helix-turn-helix transcriptional regulator [Escherichia coli]
MWWTPLCLIRQILTRRFRLYAYGYSHRHLQRLFLMYTGIPLGEYIRRRRLNRVALLLRLSQRSFHDIALSTGFDSQQSMNRDFKKNTGLTPKQYRYRKFF